MDGSKEGLLVGGTDGIALGVGPAVTVKVGELLGFDGRKDGRIDGPVGWKLGVIVKMQLSLFVEDANILVGVEMISPSQ